jgi:hypothetical protein
LSGFTSEVNPPVPPLVDVWAGKTLPPISVTGVEICTPDAADSCGKKE